MTESKCHHCGKIVRSGAQFCHRCGSRLALAHGGQMGLGHGPMPAAPSVPMRPTKGRVSALPWLIAVAALVAVGLICVIWRVRSSPQSAGGPSDGADSESATPITIPPEETPPAAPRIVREPEPRLSTSFDAAKLPDLKLPRSTSPAQSIRGIQKLGDGLRTLSLKLKADQIVGDLIWSPSGDAFFALTSNGVLSRVVLNNFVEDRRLDLGRRCSFLALCGEGLLAAMTDLQEVWIIDSDTLEVKRRISTPDVERILSGPDLKFALAACGGGRNDNRETAVIFIDLVKAETIRQPRLPTKFARITPDGKYYFAESGIEQLCSYRIDGSTLAPDQTTERIAQNGQSICVSPDSKYVCLPSGGGNSGSLYSTYVYAVDNFQRPEFTLASGAYPRLIGFDPAGEWIYAQNHAFQLIVFSMTAIKRKEYKLTDDRGSADETRQFVPHPEGKKLLVLLNDRLLFVELEGR